MMFIHNEWKCRREEKDRERKGKGQAGGGQEGLGGGKGSEGVTGRMNILSGKFIKHLLL